MGLRSGSVWLALCALLIGTASAWALTPHDKAVGVQAEHRANDAVNAQQNAPGEPQNASDPVPVIPSVHASGGNGESQPKAQESAEEGTEFWMPFRGYRFKITDSIIAAFTVLLFLATLALWWSTRALVKGADETAKRQLRAYVGIENGHLACEVFKDQIRAKPVLRIKNVGQTPAYEVTSSIGFATAKNFSDKIEATQIHIEGKTYIFPSGNHRIIGIGATLEVPNEVGTEIYVFGRIDYRDIFAAKRSTRFRFFVRNLDSPDRKGELAPCGDGNDAT